MQFLLWFAFIAFVFVVLALDLGLFNREAKVIGARQALRFTGILVAIAIGFSGVVYYLYANAIGGFGSHLVMERGHQVVRTLSGSEAAWQYLAGYLLELSLSTDNVFVIALIFKYFKVPGKFQHRVLLWGIIGALLLRGLIIWIGAIALAKFSWFMYVFGGLLIISAIKLMRTKDGAHVDPERDYVVRIARRLYPVSPTFDGERFFTKIEKPGAPGVMIGAMTPLFLALLVVETTDVLFAFDSIPAVFGVTQDPFLVFTSNVFAILGLRSLYFALASLISMFRYLEKCLVLLLFYIGAKMIACEYFDWHPHPAVALGPIFLVLGVGVLASIVAAPPLTSKDDIALPEELGETDADGNPIERA